MKKLILLLCFAPFHPLLAQKNSGLNNVFGGQFSIYTLKGAYISDSQTTYYNDNATSRYFDFQPYMAWPVSRRMLLGLKLGYRSGLLKEEYDFGSNKYLTTGLTAGSFSRFYFSPAADFSVFLEPSISFTRTYYKTDHSNGFNNPKYHNDLLAAKLAPGIAYKATKHLSFLMKLGQVGFEHEKGKDDGQPFRTSIFNLDFGLSSFLWGVEYRWGE
jgi:hypothetical protein